MVLLHDIGEVYAGDIIPSDQDNKTDRHQLERSSPEKVLGKLPACQEYLELWLEFERGESPEARFVRQVDRLEMGLQARVYQVQGFVENGRIHPLSSPGACGSAAGRDFRWMI